MVKYRLPIYAASALPCALHIGDGTVEGFHLAGGSDEISLDDGDPLNRVGGGVIALTFGDPI